MPPSALGDADRECSDELVLELLAAVSGSPVVLLLLFCCFDSRRFIVEFERFGTGADDCEVDAIARDLQLLGCCSTNF